MTRRHTITRADEIFVGDAFYGKYSPDGRAGVKLAPLHAVQFGAVVTADPDGVVDAVTTTGGDLSMSGALVSGGVAIFDVPRAVAIQCTGNNSGDTFIITGTDQYGETLVEHITGPNNTTVYGKKAFKTITAVTVNSALSGAVNVGTSNILGLPVRIASKSHVHAINVDGDRAPTATAGSTVVAGVDTAATATTGDPRGTITPHPVPNGTLTFGALVAVDWSTKEAAFGVAQYGG